MSRLLEKKTIPRLGTRAGLGLPEAYRVSFTLEELKGVPEDVISGYAESFEARLELTECPLLDRALELRLNIAFLLGHENWAGHATD
jgi:hypothetical protein